MSQPQSQQHLQAQQPVREHSVETIRRNSEVMGNLRKLMVANRGVSFLDSVVMATEISDQIRLTLFK
jgi:hypothetical protein